jgi:hypothetical protein
MYLEKRIITYFVDENGTIKANAKIIVSLLDFKKLL